MYLLYSVFGDPVYIWFREEYFEQVLVVGKQVMGKSSRIFFYKIDLPSIYSLISNLFKTSEKAL
jgi:hypothetical protein